MRCLPRRRCRAVSRSRASGSTTPRTPHTSRCAFSKSEMRVGVGYDSHRFADGEGRKLILAGVEILYALGLAGLSDADAVWPAVTDGVPGEETCSALSTTLR